MKTLENVKTKINDKMRDSQFSSDNIAQTERAINNTLEDINIANVGNDQHRQVGYDFQRQTVDIPFDNSVTDETTSAGASTIVNDSDATFQTDGVSAGESIENTTDGSVARIVSVDSEIKLTTTTLYNGTDNTWASGDTYKIERTSYEVQSTWDIKFPTYLTVGQDEDMTFEYVTPNYFTRKKVGTERMFTLDWSGNTQVVKLNWNTTEVLWLTFYNNYLAKTSSGTQKTTLDDDTDILLIPDNYFQVVVDLSVAELYGLHKGYDSNEHLQFLDRGRKRLLQMINSTGTIQARQRTDGLRIRSEWNLGRRTIRREN